MAKKVSAKERVAQQTESLLSTIEKSVNTAAAEAAKSDSNDPLAKLERLAKDFQEVHVKIEKKQRNGSKFELWTELTLPADDVINRGTDSICKEQGGGGTYRVRVRAPGDRQARATFEHSIAGPALDQPRSDYDLGLGTIGGLGSMPGFGNIANMASPRSGHGSGFGGGSQDSTKIVEAMSKQFDRTLNTTQGAADRNNQLMMTMMMSMMNNNQQATQQRQPMEDIETRKQLERMRDEMSALQRDRERERARFEKLEQDRKWEAQMAQRDKELAELKNMLQMTKGGEKDWLIPLISAMSNGQGQQTQTMVELMKMAQSKPSELEMFGNFISTVSTVMNGQFEGQARLLEVVKDALSGGDEHPIRDAVLRGMDGLMNLGSEALQAQAMRAQPVQDAEVMPPEISDPGQVEAPEQYQGLPQHEEGAEEAITAEEAADDGDVPDLLNEEEFERMARDAALQKVIAVVFNGDHPSEASARLYRHANSGNTIARKWLQWPYDVSEQVFLELLGTTTTRGPKGEIDFARSLGDDIMAFSEFLDKGGDPDKWAKSGYPLTEKKIRVEDLDPALRPVHVEGGHIEAKEESEENQEVKEEAAENTDLVDSEK